VGEGPACHVDRRRCAGLHASVGEKALPPDPEALARIMIEAPPK
jgi:hypothetical protein